MQGNYRQKLIRLVTFLGGLYFFLEFILPKIVLEKIGIAASHDQISYGFIVFGAMAIGLGIINLLMSHGSRIVFQRKDWGFSAVLLGGLMLMMCVTILEWRQGLEIAEKIKNLTVLADFAEQIARDQEQKRADVPALSFRIEKLKEASRAVLDAQIQILAPQIIEAEEIEFKLERSYLEDIQSSQAALQMTLSELSDQEQTDIAVLQKYSEKMNVLASVYGKLLRSRADAGSIKQLYEFLYTGLFVSLGSAMFSLLGVYIAAAAYRAFRVRSFESALMMSAAVVVMLGQIPFGLYLYSELPEARLWLMEVPNSAAFRAIKIGASIAGLIMAFRMWLSIESESFSDQRSGS